MMHTRQLELNLTSDAGRLPEVRDAVRRWLVRNGWPELRADEIVLAIDEALANSIQHGYGGRGDQRIVLTLNPVTCPEAGPGIEVRIRDFGAQVAPESICGRDLSELRPGGLGVHLIRAMMNCAVYERAEGGGMRLTMRKYRSHVPAPIPLSEG